MSMTKEEAIHIFENSRLVSEYFTPEAMTAVYVMALSALRGPTREQVEKAWRGVCDCSKPKACCTCCSMRCQYCIGQSEYIQATFCMKCGRPLTDEAVDMVMERLEAMRDE